MRKTYPVKLVEKYHMAQAPAKMGMAPCHKAPVEKCPSGGKEGSESVMKVARNGMEDLQHTLVRALQPTLDGIGGVSNTENSGGLRGGDTDDASGHF